MKRFSSSCLGSGAAGSEGVGEVGSRSVGQGIA